MRRGQFELQHQPQADNPRAVASSCPLCSGTGPSPANAPCPFRSAHCRGWGPRASRGTPPRLHSPGAQASRALARAPAPTLARTLIHPEGGQCPLLRPPHAPASGREGRGRGLHWPRERRTRRRSSGLQVRWCAAPRLPPTPQLACLPGALRPGRVRQGLPEASGTLGPGIPDAKAWLGLCLPPTYCF